MTYREASDFLLSLSAIARTPYLSHTSRTGAYLDRVQKLLDLLDNPEQQIPHYIHIAGTSGKGSLTHMLHAGLTVSGTRSGLLISPAPTDPRERWRVNGKMISKKEFVDIVERLKPAIEQYVETYTDDMVSYYELTIVVGLLWFAAKKVEWAVLETGMGGEFDATNIIPHKDIAVITSVGMDHTAHLGTTKTAIATTKSKIIIPGCVAYTTDRSPTVRRVIKQQCHKAGVPLHVISPSPHITHHSLAGVTWEDNDATFTVPQPGTHQARNGVLATRILTDIGVDTKSIQHAFSRLSLPARMEVVQKKPPVILDGAHNADKIATTVQTINDIAPHKRIHLVVAIAGDKDSNTIVTTLKKLPLASVAATRFTNNPYRAAAHPGALAKAFNKKNIQTTAFLDPREALHWSQTQQKKDDILLVTGSFFLSGELRPLFVPIT